MTNAAGAKVTAAVSIGPREAGGFGPAVALAVEAPSIPQATRQTLACEAQERICSCSQATRGHADMTLAVTVG